MLDIPESYEITGSVYSVASACACVTVEFEERDVTCLVEMKHKEFKLSKLVESHRCLDWGRDSRQLLICSSSGNVRTVDLRSQEVTQLCHVDTEFDNAMFVADDLVLLVGENFMEFLKH